MGNLDYHFWRKEQDKDCDSAVLEFLYESKFSWSQDGLNCEPLTCNAVT